MKTVSGKKKVPLPQIRISDCHPYVIKPLGCLNEPPYIPFVNPNPVEPKPPAICKVLPQDETYRTFRPVGTDPPEGEVDPVEQVAAFLKKLEENPGLEEELAKQHENPEPPKKTPSKDKIYKRNK